MKVRKLLLQKSGNSDSEGSDIVMPPPKVPTTRRGRKDRRTAAAAMAGTPSPACQSAEVAAVQTANARLSEISGLRGRNKKLETELAVLRKDNHRLAKDMSDLRPNSHCWCRPHRRRCQRH